MFCFYTYFPLYMFLNFFVRCAWNTATNHFSWLLGKLKFSIFLFVYQSIYVYISVKTVSLFWTRPGWEKKCMEKCIWLKKSNWYFQAIFKLIWRWFRVPECTYLWLFPKAKLETLIDFFFIMQVIKNLLRMMMIKSENKKAWMYIFIFLHSDLFYAFLAFLSFKVYEQLIFPLFYSIV